MTAPLTAAVPKHDVPAKYRVTDALASALECPANVAPPPGGAFHH